MGIGRKAFQKAAKAGWLIFSRILFLTLFGVLLNWGVFIALGPKIWGHYCHTGALAPHVSGPGAIIVLFLFCIACFKSVGLTALFIFILPFLYFFFGKSLGIRKAMAFLIHDQKEWLFDRINPLILGMIQKFRAEFSGQKSMPSKSSMASFIVDRIQQMEDAPRWLRWILKSLLNKTQLSSWILEIKEFGQSQNDEATLALHIQSRLEQEIAQKIKVDAKGPILLFLVNVVFIGVIYWLLK